MYVKNYDLINDGELLKKIVTFGIKSVIVLKKNLIANPSTINFFLKTKIKPESDDETRSFHAKKIPELGSNYICWSVILIDSVLKKDENYYLQAFLKECKCIEKERKKNFIVMILMKKIKKE